MPMMVPRVTPNSGAASPMTKDVLPACWRRVRTSRPSSSPPRTSNSSSNPRDIMGAAFPLNVRSYLCGVRIPALRMNSNMRMVITRPTAPVGCLRMMRHAAEPVRLARVGDSSGLLVAVIIRVECVCLRRRIPSRSGASTPLRRHRGLGRGLEAAGSRVRMLP